MAKALKVNVGDIFIEKYYEKELGFVRTVDNTFVEIEWIYPEGGSGLISYSKNDMKLFIKEGIFRAFVSGNKLWKKLND